MVAACGSRVVALHREALGGLLLDPELPVGDARPLTDAELTLIRGFPSPASSPTLPPLASDQDDP